MGLLKLICFDRVHPSAWHHFGTLPKPTLPKPSLPQLSLHTPVQWTLNSREQCTCCSKVRQVQQSERTSHLALMLAQLNRSHSSPSVDPSAKQMLHLVSEYVTAATVTTSASANRWRRCQWRKVRMDSDVW